MEYITLYNYIGTRCPDKYYKKREYKKALKSINNRRLFERKTKRKIFFLDDKFPKRMIDKKSFEITTNKDEADLIFIPDMLLRIKQYSYARMIKGQYHQWFWFDEETDTFANFYKNQEKYLDILDDKRVYEYSELYKLCRKNNPPLLDDEISQIKEMLISSDQDIKKIAAIMIAKSNISLNNDLVMTSRKILYLNSDDTSKLTKELRAFLNEW